MTKTLQVVELSSGKVVKTLDVRGRSEGYIDKCEMGLLRNMNLDAYSVNRIASPAEGKEAT